MRLSTQQIEAYRSDGLVFLPGLFEADEIDALKGEQARLFTLDLDTHLRAASGEFLGTTAMERHSALYARLLRDERLLGLAEQLLGPRPKGAAGSVTIFDSCMAHASGQNLSPHPRHLIYLSYNPVDNAIEKPTRPSHFAAQDFTPLTAAPRTALLCERAA